MPDRWQVAVVGAGPAGCAAARRARELGLATLLVTDAPDAPPAADARVVRGRARLSGPGRLDVESAAGTSGHRADALVLATGSRPARLSGTDPDGRLVLDADQDEDPGAPSASLIVIGAGPAGVARAAAAIRAGRDVSLVEIRDALLPGLDPDLGAAVRDRLESDGVTVLTGHRAVRVQKDEDGVVAILRRTGDRRVVEVAARAARVAVGRRPRSRGLGLEAAGVLTDRLGFIQTDAVMATSRAGIYAVGGAVATLGGIEAARREAATAVEHAAGRDPAPLRYDRIPAVLDRALPLVSVGLAEPVARAAGHLVGIGRGDLPGDPAGWIKVVADRETGEILGVHAFGPGSAACGPRILDLMAGGSAAALPDAEAGSGPSGVLDRAATAARRGDGS